MKQLLELIGARLKTKKRNFTLYEPDVSRVWPTKVRRRDPKQEAAIVAFAKEHGYEVTITDPGLRVTFRKSKE